MKISLTLTMSVGLKEKYMCQQGRLFFLIHKTETISFANVTQRMAMILRIVASYVILVKKDN